MQCCVVRVTLVLDDGVQNQAHELLLSTPYLCHRDGGLLTKVVVVVVVVCVAALLWLDSHATPLLAIFIFRLELSRVRGDS